MFEHLLVGLYENATAASISDKKTSQGQAMDAVFKIMTKLKHRIHNRAVYEKEKNGKEFSLGLMLLFSVKRI